MKATKQASTFSTATFAFGLLALAVTSANANAEIITIKSGSLVIGTAQQAVMSAGNTINLVNFIANGSGDGGGEVGGGDGDGDGTEVIPPVSGDIFPGGRAGSAWIGRDYPNVPQAQEHINFKNAQGVTNKYVYYAIDTNKFGATNYLGKISLVTNTSSGQALFSAWISTTPGGEPIAPRCTAGLALDNTLNWSTNYKKAPIYTCKLNSSTQYYLNISDRTSEQLRANQAGTCTSSRGCMYTLNANGFVR